MAQVVKVLANALTLAFQKAFHRIGKRRMSEPVGAGGFDGQQSPRQFVLALGAALKPLVAVLNAPFQWLVVAGFKVKAVHPLQRAPVTPVGDRFRFI